MNQLGKNVKVDYTTASGMKIARQQLLMIPDYRSSPIFYKVKQCFRSDKHRLAVSLVIAIIGQFYK
jgi:hypothetical protein